MAKGEQRTKIFINGTDVSSHVSGVNLPRFPGTVEQVEFAMEVSDLDVESDGTLVIFIDAEE